MHKAFELIVKDYPNLKDIDYYKQKALEEIELNETIFKKLYEVELIDLIEKFIEYLKEEDIKNSLTEVEFYLDEDLNIANEDNYFLKGYIDRIDINEEVEIIDYKSSKKENLDYKKIEEIQNLKDLQLGIYAIYAKQKYKKPVTASLLTFKPEKLKFATLKECDKPEIKRKKPQYACYNPEYEKKLKSKVKEIKEKISQGYFIYDNSDEEVCEWCEFKLICKRYENE
ncbi:hypothetical protein JCM11957_03250 [Caminibacter profundus]